MITQEYINGYISSLNNLLFIYRNELVTLRKQYYYGISEHNKPLIKGFLQKCKHRYGGFEIRTCITRSDYKVAKNVILHNINKINTIKQNYKDLVKNINKLNK
jgi:hypothetical protein